MQIAHAHTDLIINAGVDRIHIRLRRSKGQAQLCAVEISGCSFGSALTARQTSGGVEHSVVRADGAWCALRGGTNG
jgi:hypothetical protein